MTVIKIPYRFLEPCTLHEVPDAADMSIEESGKVFTAIKDLIGIEWGEIVLTTIRREDRCRDYCLIVDEVGKMKVGWHERINLRASQFYAGTPYGDPIVGDVILCARQWNSRFGECDLAGLTLLESCKFMKKLN